MKTAKGAAWLNRRGSSFEDYSLNDGLSNSLNSQ